MNLYSTVINFSRTHLLLLAATLLVLQSASSLGDFHETHRGGQSGTPRPMVDPEMLQHLRQLFLRAKQLGRPLVNGEMNLLPEGAKGFANSVRCFSDISATSVVRDDSRMLQFNLSSLSITDTIVAVDLVLKQPANFPSYRTQLHEIVGEESSSWQDLKLLDTGDWEGQWHTLHVENMLDSIDPKNRRRNYRLVLSVSQIEEEENFAGGAALDEGSLLRVVKPMLLVYTNSLNLTSESLGTRSPPPLERNNMATRVRGKEEVHTMPGPVRRRRSVGSQLQGTAQSVTELSLDELAKRHCQKNVRYMSFQELGWPGDDAIVVTPAIAKFSFCHGLCNRANQREYEKQYTDHAKIISLAKSDLLLAGISPCCVPESYNPIDVTYRDIFTDVVTMTTFPEVSSCKCM